MHPKSSSLRHGHRIAGFIEARKFAEIASHHLRILLPQGWHTAGRQRQFHHEGSHLPSRHGVRSGIDQLHINGLTHIGVLSTVIALAKRW
jgi:hypothetical protein